MTKRQADDALARVRDALEANGEAETSKTPGHVGLINQLGLDDMPRSTFYQAVNQLIANGEAVKTVTTTTTLRSVKK